jgi:hypothetical protein
VRGRPLRHRRNLDALTLLLRAEKTVGSYSTVRAWRDLRDTTAGLKTVGEIVAMPVDSFVVPGVFEPETIAAMSEAFEAACEVIHEVSQPNVVREIIAGRIIAAARFGERDPVRLQAAALAGRQIG